MKDPLGIKNNDPLGLKKKVASKSLSQEELWGSDSQPQDLYTSLATEKQGPQPVLDGSDGLPKMKQFTGFTPEEQKTLQAKPAEKKPVINKEIQEKIIKAEFKPKEYRDVGSRLIDKLATGSSQLGATLATIPEYGYELSVAPQKFIAEIFNIPSLNPDTEEFKKQADSRNAIKNYYQKEVSDLKEKSNQLDQQYSQGVYESFINGDYTTGFEQLTNSFTESLPTTASIMVGGAYVKAPQILAASTMLFGTEKSEQLRKENPELTANTRIANSLASGFAQAITETIGSASIGSAAKALLSREGEKKSISILKDGLIEYYKSSLKKVPLTASAIGEGIEEWSSQVAENAVDVATGVKPKDYNVFEGGSDALLGGVFGGVVFGAGLTGIKNTIKYQDRIKIKENNKNIFNLQSQLENQSITPEIKEEINYKIEKLILENKKYVQDDVSKIESLSDDVKEKLVSSTNKIDELTSKAKEINSYDEITVETKAILLEDLKKDAVENAQLKNSILNGTYVEDREVEITPTAEAAPTLSGQKVSDIINRPAVLESQAGSKLEVPVEGSVYQEGQRVIFEDKNNKTYDLGNVDEISDKTVEELGIKPQEEMVNITPEGKIKIGNNEWNMQSELPNYGIEYDNDGNVKAVSLKDDAGKTVMYEGQVAEDTAYQVLLKQTETPEQRQAINEILENDEELNRQLREAEKAAEEAAAEVTEPGATKTQAEQYSEELDKTKEADPDNYWSVSPVSAEDAAKGTIIDTEDGSAIVKPDGDIAGLFKKATSKAKGVAQDLLKRAVAAGGKKLDNYDTYLTPQYIKAGFRVASRTPFNEKYAPPGWNKKKHGTPDVVAMVYDPENDLDIEEKTFNDPDTGYDEAIAYRDSLLEPSIDLELEGLAKLFDESDNGFRMSQVDKAKEALKSILPGVKFIVHETNEAYNKAVGDNSSGAYIYRAEGDKVIHINKQNANGRTVAHEVFHAVILDKIKGDKAVQEITARMVDAVYKTASPELKSRLDAFASRYADKTIRDEERLAELIGIIADGYPQMSPANKNIVKRWLDALAKKFGLKPFTDNEVIDMLNTLARKVSTGEVVSEQDLNIFKGGKKVDTPSDGLTKRFQYGNDKVKIEIKYLEQDRVEELKEKGLLTEPENLSFLNGKKVVTTSPDDMLVGSIFINGKEVATGNGGVYFVTKFGDVWANSNKGVANGLAKAINETYDTATGKSYLALVKGTDAKLVSSPQGVTSSLAVTESMIDAGLFSLSDFRSAVRSAIKSNGGDILLSPNGSAKTLKSEVDNFFKDVTSSTFEKRGNVLRDIVSNLAKSESAKINKTEIIKFLNGNESKGLGVGKTEKSQSLIDLIATTSAEKLTKGLSTGDVYAVIEIDGKVKVVQDSHQSYPYHIKIIDENGNISDKKPILILPKNRRNGKEILTSVDGKTAKELGPGFSGKVGATANMPYGKGIIMDDSVSIIKRSQKADDITIEYINFEEESEDIDVYEASETAEKIAKDNGINILRGKDLISVALNKDGDVVGGLWTEISGDEFSFDIAVDKASQGKGIGEKLVNEAVSEFNAQNDDYQLKYKIDVTNPIMEKLLSKYGFKVVNEIPGHTIMEHPTNDPKLEIKRSQLQEDGVNTVSESFFNDADKIFPNDHILGGYAVTDSKGKLIGRVKLSEVNDNTVKIDEVVSEKKGERTGNGSAIMKMVIDNADKNNTRLTLTANLILGIKAKGFETAKKLQSFYEKFGFIKGANGLMTREPVAEIKRSQLTDDKYVHPGFDAALEAAGETEKSISEWEKKNAVKQQQKRTPKVQEAAEKYFNEEISQEELLGTVKKEMPIKSFTKVPAIPTFKDLIGALDKDKVAKGIVGLTKKIADGVRVASRLDIPAYERFDKWVVSVHDGIKDGLAIAYGQTAVLKNVDFSSFPGIALNIARGKVTSKGTVTAKTPMARIFGDWVNEDPQSVHDRAVKLMNDPEWVQVGMNPFRHSWFYDKADGMPIKSAEEVIQVGALVLAKKPVKVSPDDPMFKTKSAKGNEIRFQQAKTIDEMVRIARQSNYSDAAITAFLKTKGFSDAQIANALAVNANRPSVNKIYEDSKKAIEDKKKRVSIKDLAPFLRKSLLDRQAYIKRVINRIDNKSAKKAYDLLVTKAGASALASERFKRAEKKIYGGLNSEDMSTLDKIIYAKRMVAVNESRAKLGLEPYKGMDGYSIDDANQDLADFKNLLGDKKFNDLSSRATEYFDSFKLNLKKLYESGRISKEVYESLKDTEYSPIKTIKYIIGDNLSVDEIDTQAKSLGIARKDIMKLSDSNENEIIMDSKWLLAMSINSVEGRAFENNMLREFDKAIKSATPEEKKAFEDIVLDNPVVGTKKDGGLKYKYDDTRLPVGYAKVSYFNDGNKVEIVLKDQYAKQLLDVKNKNKALETLGKLTGTKILRFFATGGNPLFIIGNTAVDFQNIAFFSNVYSKFKPMATAQLARDYTKNFVKKLVVSNEYNTIFNEYINHGGALDYMASDGLRSLESMNPVNGVTKAVQKGLVAYGRAMSLLGETSEVAFRLSVFQKVKDDAIKDFKKENNRDPNSQELDDILWNAGRQSRETMDFSQGGDVAKNIDAVFPYFNAALQGIRRPIDFAKNDPVGFSSSVLQYTAMASSLAAGSFAMLISAVGGDDDDDEKKVKKIINVLNSISEYEKANYHIMFTGNINKDGEYEYYRAKKLPVLSVISTVAEQLIYKTFFESKGIDYDMDSKAMLEAVNKSNPLPVTVQEVAAKNPVASGLVSYWANKDTFTGDKIFREPDNKKILPEAEGMFDNRVDQIYKDLAPGFGLSPARTKVMVEKVITSANTNPTIPLIYSAYDGLFSKNDGPAAEAKEAMKNVGDAFGKKLVRYTDKNIIRYKNQDEREYQESLIETKVWNSEQKVYNEIKKKYESGGSITKGELIDLVKENFEPMDYMKYAKKYNAYIHNMNIDKSVLDIIFEDVPEVQAMKLNQRYGPNLESEELKELGKAMNSAGKRINSKSIYIYNKKYKNRTDAQ